MTELILFSALSLNLRVLMCFNLTWVYFIVSITYLFVYINSVIKSFLAI
jgi:hypothetical protein